MKTYIFRSHNPSKLPITVRAATEEAARARAMEELHGPLDAPHNPLCHGRCGHVTPYAYQGVGLIDTTAFTPKRARKFDVQEAEE